MTRTNPQYTTLNSNATYWILFLHYSIGRRATCFDLTERRSKSIWGTLNAIVGEPMFPVNFIHR